MTALTTRFTPQRPVSMAEGRFGELIVVQGGGVRPARWSGDGVAVDAGIDAPSSAPAVTADGDPLYYVARVDINKPGACYYSPPEVSFVTTDAPSRPAQAAAYLNQAAVAEVRVADGGKGYPAPPAVELSSTHGKGAVIVAVLDAPDTGPDDPNNSKITGLTSWEIVQGPPFMDEVDAAIAEKTFWRAFGPVEIPIVNGSGRITRRLSYANGSCGGQPNLNYIDVDIPYTVSGVTQGSGASVRIGFTGHSVTLGGCTQVSGPPITRCVCDFTAFYSYGVTGATPVRYGAGYASDATITVLLPAYQSWDATNRRYVPAPSSKTLIIRGYSGESDKNASTERYPVKSLLLKDGGSGYLVAPQLKMTSNTGFGAYATCKVRDGKISEVRLENSGGGYRTPPTVEVLSGDAEAFAVSRPHVRGKYQCYYRYVDSTAEDAGGPIPSNLSPLREVDAGEGRAQLTWEVPDPVGRATHVELWRSTSNEATTLYRVASLSLDGDNPDDPNPPEPLRIIFWAGTRTLQNNGAGVAVVSVAGGPAVAPVFVWQWLAPGGEWEDVPSPLTTLQDGGLSSIWYIRNWPESRQGYKIRAIVTRGRATVISDPADVIRPVTPQPPPPPNPCDCTSNLILNGDFESVLAEGIWEAGGRLAVWTTQYVDIHSVSYYHPSAPVNRFCDLNACAKGFIEQSFATVTGGVYRVSFQYAGSWNPDGSPDHVCRGTVSAAGQSMAFSTPSRATSGYAYNTWPPPTYAELLWQPTTFEFTATGSTTTLRFEGADYDFAERCYGVNIDCVCVQRLT